MPWEISDVERHSKGLSPRQKRVWVRVANAALARCLEEGRAQSTCEGTAIRQANAVAGRMPKTQALQRFAVHVAGATVRYETLDGRRYAVATVVPIREGVLNQFYVPAAEIAAFVQSWDGVAMPLGHPKNSWGDHVSVNSPTHIAQSIGRFFGAQWDGERLTGEAWIDIAKCENLGGEALDVLERIEAGEPMECSTAFWAETDPTPGTWNGIDYLGVHKHLRPDHLAILPHTTGACSLENGCGLRALEDCACEGACTCTTGDDPMTLDAEEKSPGKLRQALRTLFAFAQSTDPDDLPDPPKPPPDPDEEEEEEPEEKPDEAPVTQARIPQPEPITPQEKGRYTMLTKQELVGRLVAHEHASWTTEQTPVLLTLEERVLEQMLQELDRRQQEAPLTLKALQNELNTRDVALRAEYDQKLATHVQALEEKQERTQLLSYFEARGRAPEEIAAMPLSTLRWMHQELSPVSYIGNGLPRLSGHSIDDDLPDDSPRDDL